MLLNWDSSLLIAAAASFMVGLLGYIIARLWIKPIVGYQMTKRKLNRELTRYLDQLAVNEQTGHSNRSSKAQALLKQARRQAMNLETRFAADIPAWYRLMLVSRGQSPQKALALLAPVSKLKDSQQIAARVDEARKTVGLA